MIFHTPVAVAIPVRNEEGLVGECLRALAAQSRLPDHVVLLLNNCTDRTFEICEAARRHFPAIRIFNYELEGPLATAGEARRLALEHALELAGEGVVLTTDADALPGPEWIAANVAEIARGADAVCGMAAIDERERPDGWHRFTFDDMREALLRQLHDEMAALVDPDPVDPWPRHQQHSGASIAVRAAMLLRAGGAPRVAVGEDRALIARLRMVDAKVRHAQDISVTVSGRAHGRAQGGMAETIRRRCEMQDLLLDDALEPTVDAYRRVIAQARLRSASHDEDGAEDLARDLLITRADFWSALREPYFGAAWAKVQSVSPVLGRRRVRFADLARETRQALSLVGHLRGALAERAVARDEHSHLPVRGARHAG